MAKINLTDIASLTSTSAVTAINDNNAELVAAFDNVLSRDGTAPNTMASTLDMNSNRIINLPNPSNDSEPVTKAYGDARYTPFGDITDAVTQAQTAATTAQASVDIVTQAAADAISAASGTVHFDTAQTLTSGEQAQARSNIGLATVASSASASDLTTGTLDAARLPTLSLANISDAGTAAALNYGTSANQLVRLDGSAKLPAVDGSQLTGIVSGSNFFYAATSNGIVGDGVRNTDGAISASSNSFTSASASFTADDVGKSIVINGAGASGVSLSTTIAAYVSATNVTLTATASTTVSGAIYCYGTDNTTAINTLITSVNAAHGGTIMFSPGLYCVTGTIDMSTTNNITLSGPSRVRNIAYGGLPSGIVSLATDGNPVIKMGSTFGGTIQNLWCTYISPQKTGNYIYIANTVVYDAGYNKVTGCEFYTNTLSINSITFWIKFDKVITCYVTDNTFIGGTNHIGFANSSGSYANQILIDSNIFAQQVSTALNGGGQSITVSNNTFEQRSDGQGIVYSTSSTFDVNGFVWTGNWFGDATAAGGPWLNIYGNGFVFSGNFMVGNASAIGLFLNNVSGFQITGNQFYSFSTAILYQTATCNGGIVQGNNFHACSTVEGGTGNKGANVTTSNNSTV